MLDEGKLIRSSHLDALDINNQSALAIHALTILYVLLILPLVFLFTTSVAIVLIGYLFAFSLLLNYRSYKRLKKALVITTILFALWYLFLYLAAAYNFTMGGVFIYMIIKLFPCAIMGSLLMFDIKTNQIISAIGRLNVPKQIVLSLTVAIKFFPTYRREFKYVKDAMASRGIRPRLSQPLRYFEFFMIPMLFRSYHIAEEMAGAALTKGIDSTERRTSIYPSELHGIDYFIMVFATLLLLYVWLARWL